MSAKLHRNASNLIGRNPLSWMKKDFQHNNEGLHYGEQWKSFKLAKSIGKNKPGKTNGKEGGNSWVMTAGYQLDSVIAIIKVYV